ncbi:MAG: hypothetical protein ABR584_13115, partial [Candidatus Baltobacteraceae bacterium]
EPQTNIPTGRTRCGLRGRWSEVRAMNVRDTADFDTDRSTAVISSLTGPRARQSAGADAGEHLPGCRCSCSGCSATV